MVWPLTPEPEEKVRLVRQKLPRHIAIAIDVSDQSVPDLQVNSIKKLIELQAKLGIPMLTFNVLPCNSSPPLDALAEALDSLVVWPGLREKGVKLSVLGRWYDLPERVVEKIKQVVLLTQDNCKVYVNIGINYDGQEELVDAISRIARQVRTGKVDAERITKDTIKSSLDTALLPAPDLVIMTGKTFSLRSFMLWDSAYAKIYFSNVPWGQLRGETILKALVFYQNTSQEKTAPIK